MSYISVSEEEGAEPIELPTEEDGTGQLYSWLTLTTLNTSDVSKPVYIQQLYTVNFPTDFET